MRTELERPQALPTVLSASMPAAALGGASSEFLGKLARTNPLPPNEDIPAVFSYARGAAGSFSLFDAADRRLFYRYPCGRVDSLTLAVSTLAGAFARAPRVLVDPGDGKWRLAAITGVAFDVANLSWV